MGLLGWLILFVVALFAGIAVRSLVGDARRRGMGLAQSGVRTVLGGAVFFVVLVTTAVIITRVVGGPGAPDDCAGDECDANMAYIFPFLFLGLPAGIAAGWTATVALRRLWH